MIYKIHPHDLVYILPLILPLLNKLLKYNGNTYTIDSCLDKIIKNEWDLWVTYDKGVLIACAITGILCYPNERCLEIIGISGSKLNSLISLYPRLKDFGHKQGCTSIRICGRPAWERVLKHYGIEKVYTVYKLPITE